MLCWRLIISLIWKSWKQQSFATRHWSKLGALQSAGMMILSTPWRHPSSVEHIDTELSMIICFPEFSFTVTSFSLHHVLWGLKMPWWSILTSHMTQDWFLHLNALWTMKHLCRNILYLDATPFGTFVLKFVSSLRIYKSFKIIRGICQLYIKYM